MPQKQCIAAAWPSPFQVLLLRHGGTLGGLHNVALTTNLMGMLFGKGYSLALTLLEMGPAGGSEQAAAQLLQAQLQAARLCLISGGHVVFNAGAFSPRCLTDWLATMTALLSRLQAAPGDAAVKGGRRANVLLQIAIPHVQQLVIRVVALLDRV